MGIFAFKKSLRTRFVWVVLLVLSSLSVLMVAQYMVFTNANTRFDHIVRHSMHEYRELINLQDAMYQAVMVPNDYLIHGNVNERKLYDKISYSIEHQFKELSKEMAMHKDELDKLNDSRAIWGQAHKIAEKIMASDQPVGDIELSQEMELMDEYAEKSIKSLQVILEFAHEEISKEAEDVNGDFKIMAFLIFGGTFGGVIIIMWLNNMIVNSCINPLCCLVDAAKRIGDGDYSSRMFWDRADEIGDVSRAIDTMALKLEKSHKALEELSTKDSLTNVYNRREFDRYFQHEITRALRYQRNLSIVIVDVDNFKNINDTYGHLVGDDVLRSMAMVMDEVIRDSDQLARYGGEEFVITLPEVDSEAAYIVAEKLRKAVEKINYTISDGVTIKMTISAGTATLPLNGDNASDLLVAADTALYNAKHRGRNNTVCAE